MTPFIDSKMTMVPDHGLFSNGWRMTEAIIQTIDQINYPVVGTGDNFRETFSMIIQSKLSNV
jgi:hypothetical protein